MELKEYIKDIVDFPTKGIVFRDVTPLMQDGKAYREAIDHLKDYCLKKSATVIAGPEARGFLFGCPVAYSLGLGFVPVRKPGKLPRETVSVSYDLEYGSNVLHMHQDAIQKGDKVVLCDDLLATGGTIKAAIELVEKLGGEVVGCCFLIELTALNGRALLEGYDVYSVLQYD